jgi:cytochrome d ubiquinol oxidase subunit II
MDLNTVWFILIMVLFIGFFFLEGFDYGVGMLLPFLGKDDKQRRVIINSIGTFWDGNEVWLLTAGGATFAAFPNWYATMFSGFYIALVLMLLGLIVRAVAFEYRSKEDNWEWRNRFDWLIFIGSFLPAFLWGVAVSNLIRGVPIDAQMNYVGGFFNLLNPFALLGGIAFVLLFILHGAIFLSLKTTDEVLESARNTAKKYWLPTVIVIVLYVVYAFFDTGIYQNGSLPIIATIIAALALISVTYFLKVQKEGWAFIMTALTIVFVVVTVFSGLYPNVMISSLNPEWSLTVYNASSSPYTLKVMTIVTLILIPFVLAYQGWTYYIFRQRISTKDESKLEY